MAKRTSEPRSHQLLRFLNYVRLAHPDQCYRAIYQEQCLPESVFINDISRLIEQQLICVMPYRVTDRQVLAITRDGAERVKDDYRANSDASAPKLLSKTELITRLKQCGYVTAEYPQFDGNRTRNQRSQSRKKIAELAGKRLPGSWQLLLHEEEVTKVLLAVYPNDFELKEFDTDEDKSYETVALVDSRVRERFPNIEVILRKQLSPKVGSLEMGQSASTSSAEELTVKSKVLESEV
jgi:hypothetical protein